MVYLIESEYVGPNKRDSEGHILGDTRVMSIYREPGRTNMSHQVCVDGWLGTSNDNHLAARGEFETIDAARAAAALAGFTEPYEGAGDDDCIEGWISVKAARAQWDAGDYFLNGLGAKGTCSAYGITAEATDEELQAAVDKVDADANADNDELHGTYELFEELRQNLRDELETADECLSKQVVR